MKQHQVALVFCLLTAILSHVTQGVVSAINSLASIIYAVMGVYLVFKGDNDSR